MSRSSTAKWFTALDGMAGGAAWTAVGAVFARGATMLYAIMIARVLGREAAGQFSIVQNTGMLVLTLMAPGLHTVATRELAERSARGVDTASLLASIVRVAWLMGVVGTATLFLCADWIVTNVLGASRLAVATRVGGGMIVLFGTLAAVGGGALMGLHRFRPIAMANLASGAVGLVAVPFGALEGGVTGAIIGLGVAYAANWLMLQRALPATERTSVHRQHSGTGQLMRMSLPLSVSYGVYGVSNWLAVAALGRSEHGYGAVALFTVGNQWQTAILFLPTALSVVLLPRLAGLLSFADRASFRDTFGATVLVNLGLTIAGVGFVVVCAPLLLALYGPEFRGGEPTLYAMAFGSLPVILSNLTSQVLYARGMLRAAVWAQVAYGVAIAGLATWLIPRSGALGLALATAGAHCVLAFANVAAIATERRSGALK